MPLKTDQHVLLEAIRLYPSIYDRSSSEFRDKPIKDNSWAAIARQLHSTSSECKSKYRTIRGRIAAYLRGKIKPSGSAAASSSENIDDDYEQHKWIFTHIYQRKGLTNIPQNISETSRYCDDTASHDDDSNPIFTLDADLGENTNMEDDIEDVEIIEDGDEEVDNIGLPSLRNNRRRGSKNNTSLLSSSPFKSPFKNPLKRSSPFKTSPSPRGWSKYNKKISQNTLDKEFLSYLKDKKETKKNTDKKSDIDQQLCDGLLPHFRCIPQSSKLMAQSRVIILLQQFTTPMGESSASTTFHHTQPTHHATYSQDYTNTSEHVPYSTPHLHQYPNQPQQVPYTAPLSYQYTNQPSYIPTHSPHQTSLPENVLHSVSPHQYAYPPQNIPYTTPLTTFHTTQTYFQQTPPTPHYTTDYNKNTHLIQQTNLPTYNTPQTTTSTTPSLQQHCVSATHVSESFSAR